MHSVNSFVFKSHLNSGNEFQRENVSGSSQACQLNMPSGNLSATLGTSPNLQSSNQLILVWFESCAWKCKELEYGRIGSLRKIWTLYILVHLLSLLGYNACVVHCSALFTAAAVSHCSSRVSDSDVNSDNVRKSTLIQKTRKEGSGSPSPKFGQSRTESTRKLGGSEGSRARGLVELHLGNLTNSTEIRRFFIFFFVPTVFRRSKEAVHALSMETMARGLQKLAAHVRRTAGPPGVRQLIRNKFDGAELKVGIVGEISGFSVNQLYLSSICIHDFAAAELFTIMTT
ncbi:hypothetical protein R3P38DRAFT_2783707 [Favolaschia claudopus]|uniref:Uncharacterized protein n=1 Tax=Favolaschia claudopus TaxID=2862362 RepID=A0AAW0AZ67_9AGAR